MLDRIQASLSALPPAEQRVGKLVVADARKFVNMPISEIADRSHVSKPTVVPPKAVVTVAAPPARSISDNEFKTLRTIDEELVIYVIKKGDSLASVAQKYYGSTQKERIIADLNFIENPSSVKIGEEIIVDVCPLAKKKGKQG